MELAGGGAGGVVQAHVVQPGNARVRAIRARERAMRLARPAAQYSRPFLQRGTPWSIETFGATRREATPEQLARRNASFFTGRGLYGGQGKYSVGKGLRALGGYAKSIGKIARTGLGIARDVRGITGGGLYGGQGRYDPTPIMKSSVSNSLMDMSNAEPSMTIHAQADETDDFSFTLEEYIKPIYAPTIAASTSSSFNSQIIDINPGLQNLAPKLAAISANYCHYEIHQLVFRFKSKVNESNVNKGIAGDIMMTFNYDPANDSFDSVTDIMQSSGRIMGRIVDNLVLGVECDDAKSKDTKYFVRTSPVPLGRDIDEYDHGRLVIATNNIPSDYSNLAIGDLYMYYTVTLKQFKPGSSKLNNQQFDIFVCPSNVTEANIFSNATTTLDAGTAVVQQSNIGGLVTASASKQLFYTFPADVEGFFEVTLRIEGTSLSNTGLPAVALTGANITFIADMYAAGGVGDSPAAFSLASSATNVIYTTHIRVRAATSNANNALRLQYDSGTGGSVTSWSLEVKELTQNSWQSRNVQVPKFVNVASGIEVAI